MKIVNYDEFFALSGILIFSEIGVGGLYKREKILFDNDGIPYDFFQITILPPTMAEDLEVIGDRGRWGVFDKNSKFVIFDKDDVENMKKNME